MLASSIMDQSFSEPVMKNSDGPFLELSMREWVFRLRDRDEFS